LSPTLDQLDGMVCTKRSGPSIILSPLLCFFFFLFVCTPFFPFFGEVLPCVGLSAFSRGPGFLFPFVLPSGAVSPKLPIIDVRRQGTPVVVPFSFWAPGFISFALFRQKPEETPPPRGFTCLGRSYHGPSIFCFLVPPSLSARANSVFAFCRGKTFRVFLYL